MATEQEFKFFLTRDQMAGLERRARREREPEEKLQVNYYYDTQDRLLRRREITLRARLTETYLELQYKRRLPQEGGFRRHEEWSQPLGRKLPGRLKLCLGADGRGEKVLCVRQGALVTRRRRFRFSEGLQLDLDTSLYLGVCDWEAELEFCPETEPAARSLLVSLGLEKARPSTLGKAERFFCRLEEDGGTYVPCEAWGEPAEGR